MTLPATLIEAEARAYARFWIRRYSALSCWHNIPFLRLPCPILDPDAGHIWMQNYLKQSAMAHPFSATEIIALARAGWKDADIAISQLAAEHLDRGEPPPAQVAAYAIEKLHPNSGGLRGRDRGDHVFQDIAMAFLVVDLVERFPIKPTGRSARRPSACKIAADAFSERTAFHGRG
jgi:hypothetical protein